MKQPLKILTILLAFIGILSSFYAHTNSAKAQIHQDVVALNSETDYADLTQKIYVFEDQFKKYNLAAAWKEINSNASELLQKSDRLRMVNAGSSYWMLLKVNNQSETSQWVFDFGDTYAGRSGFLNKLMMYDVTNRNMVIKLFGPDKVDQQNPENLVGNVVMLDLPIGETTQVLFYIEPADKKPVIISPQIVNKTLYFGRGIALMDRYDVTVYAYLGLLFMMLTFTLVYRKPHQIFGTLFLFFGLIYYVSENTVLYLDETYHEYILFLSFIFMLISGLYVFYNYFYDKVLSPNSIRQLVIFVPLVSVIMTSFSLWVVPSEYAFLTFLLAVVIVGAVLLILFFSNLGSKALAKYLTIFGGVLYTIIMAIGAVTLEYPIEPAMSYITPMFVYAQLALSVFLILSMPIRRGTEKKASAPLSGIGKNVFQGSANFRETKDIADRERLLRVLDRERELLEEARDREALKTEEMRRAKEVADEANHAKSAFLAVISHEIRTPITGVLGMVKLLLGSQLNATQKDYAQTIQDSGDAMLALLNDILDYEKIESGKLELETISFDVKRMMQGIERLMMGHAEAKSVGLLLTIEPDVPEYLIGDPTRIRQVILNLVSNAIKFTEHGDVRILVKKIDVGTTDAQTSSLAGDAPANSIYFSVQDNGIGISSEAQKTLFTPFTQAKAETTRKYGGTGLGLSICQKLVNAMGGEISISSKEGEGSTFFFTVDMAEGNAQEAVSEDASSFEPVAHDGKRYKVLAVDDNSINLKVLNGFIDKVGHVCVKAESGEDAIDMLTEEDFDIILMDVNMRGMSGLETTKNIRGMQHVEKSAIPIVALTGNSGQDAVHECYSAGMDDFILKPISPKSLNDVFVKLENNSFGNELTTQKYAEIRSGKINNINVDVVPEPEVNEQVTSQPKAPEQVISAESVELNVNDLPPLPSEMDAGLDEETLESGEDIAEYDDNDSSTATPLQEFVSAEQASEGKSVDAIVASVGASQEGMIDAAFIEDIEARGEIFEESLLEALKLSMNAEELNSLVDGFDEKAQEILSGVQEAYSKKDWTSLAQRAHEMKGMSGNFGLRALSEIMKEMEVIVKTKKFNEVEYFVVRAPMAYKAGIDRIRDWINKN